MTDILKCVSPVDGAVYAERQAFAFERAASLIAAAQTAQREWAKLPIDDRARLVLAGVAALGEQQQEMTTELARMMGRPTRYGGEFAGVKERADYMASIAADALAPTIIEDSAKFERRILRAPLGVVLVIAPWNYPYLTAINTVAPALIAGNAVILKHATQTLLAGERLVAAFTRAGVPDAVLRNVFLTHKTTAELIAARQFNAVNFTGSVGGGQAIERAAAGTFTAVGLELGGKDPAYVMEDADANAAAAAITDAAMFNSGQCCCGIERVYVCAQRYETVLERMIELTASYKLGNPLNEATTLGPMAHKRFADHARAQVREAVAAGATARIAAMDEDDGGAYLSPQVLTDAPADSRVMREETFAPVVCVTKVKDDDEAARLMNDSDYGLTASLWTGDAARAARLGERLDTGTVFMNRADYLDPALCWTGRKNTGRGGSLSHIGYANLTRPQSFHFRKAAP